VRRGGEDEQVSADQRDATLVPGLGEGEDGGGCCAVEAKVGVCAVCVCVCGLCGALDPTLPADPFRTSNTERLPSVF
jgi:hypothetical protein